MKAAFLSGDIWHGAAQGFNLAHKACTRVPHAENLGKMCGLHFKIFLDNLPTEEARGEALRIRRS